MYTKPPIAVGSSVSLTRTIGESDVALFAGMTGDDGPNHMDEEFSKRTAYGRRVVQGAYLLGIAAGAGVLLNKLYDKGRFLGASYGYDKVRFVRPVFIGDTLTMTYTIRQIDDETLKTYSDCVGTNQHGTVCFAATHINKGMPPKSAAAAPSPSAEGGKPGNAD